VHAEVAQGGIGFGARGIEVEGAAGRGLRAVEGVACGIRYNMSPSIT
jgi:hypothetical protein